MAYLWIALGLGFLFWGGDLLVRGAVQMALRWKVSSLVIGMTVVSSATSAPELLVSLQAAMEGHADIALGNVIGSNIANITLILGLTAIVFPLAIAEDTIKRNFPITLGVSVLLMLFMFWDNTLSRLEGLILFVLLVVYTFTAIRRSRREHVQVERSEEEIVNAKAPVPLWKSVGYLLLGVVALKFGADWLIQGSVTVALDLGIDERVISLSIVAVGTSVPELAASLVSAIKKEQDISLGNLLGSNIFNVLSVLGLTSIIHPVEATNRSLMVFDVPVMIAAVMVLFPMMVWITNRKIGRWEGLFLVLFYGGYMAYIF